MCVGTRVESVLTALTVDVLPPVPCPTPCQGLALAMPSTRQHLPSAGTVAVALLISALVLGVLVLVLHAFASARGENLCRFMTSARLPRWLLEADTATMQHAASLGLYDALRLGTGSLECGVWWGLHGSGVPCPPSLPSSSRVRPMHGAVRAVFFGAVRAIVPQLSHPFPPPPKPYLVLGDTLCSCIAYGMRPTYLEKESCFPPPRFLPCCTPPLFFTLPHTFAVCVHRASPRAPSAVPEATCAGAPRLRWRVGSADYCTPAGCGAWVGHRCADGL